MSPEATALWDRALKALEAAKILVDIDADGAASRAYYAAFYAVSALFALEGTTFTKHTSVAAAVHRDLVRAGRWGEDLGQAYSWLMRLRQTGDYGQGVRVRADEARQAIAKAASIVRATKEASGGLLP
ncbi:MAG TPA: HEPN domain-containing protein [Phycisphaerae bacterium]|nr:HEPN domain-containing protein [Phycisphaerae bacterium]